MDKRKLRAGSGKAIKFLMAHKDYQGADCVIWPMCTNPESGYGYMGWKGKRYRAHMLMCELAHGARPSLKHEVRHSCHNPSCVNPRHLAWGTHADNIRDKIAAGTHYRAQAGRRWKLTPEQVRQARALKGKMSQANIGRLFGVCEASIRSLHKGRTYSNVA